MAEMRTPRRARKAGDRRWIRWGGAAAFGSLAVGLAAMAVVALGYHREVVVNPGPHLSRAHVLSIIAEESPVYYRDGKTRIGVFFDAEHRQYLNWDELPTAWVVSIVAAEDGGFWSHPGIDIWGLARAMRDNLVAGGVVAGGSTLTQQTAKNLYYRPDRTLRSKWVELLNALRLEVHFEKRDILTFYANQFHVTGNGRGLAIGARYFFDKDVSQLTLPEAAFLAGLVKAPGRYDPFRGEDVQRALAIERAHDRTRYVLRRILDVPVSDLAGPRSRETVNALRAEASRLLDDGFELDFTKGTFRYESSAILDEVARRLSEPPFDAVLEANGIEDPSTAGLVVVTTLDGEAQQGAVYGLWHHLTEVGVMLEALGPEAFVEENGHPGPDWDPEVPLRPHTFRWARVARHRAEPKAHFEVDLGGRSCVVDRDAMVRVAVASVRGKTGDRNGKASGEVVDAFVDAIPDGSVVRVSVREVGADGSATCDLEVRPELQGAVMVVENGQIRAMVGGNDNRNFNRATALRQMGSTWKPLVFHAAIQLGWRPDDLLDNRRSVFPYSTTLYDPRPDHLSLPEMSMAWAGVNSENVASVWLLYHLVDKLDGEGIRGLAESLGLNRRADETEDSYRLRMQRAGVLSTRNRVSEGWFLQARQEVLAGLPSGTFPEDTLALQSMLYGWGLHPDAPGGQRGNSRVPSESFAHTWLAIRTRIDACEAQHRRLVDALDLDSAPTLADVPDLRVRSEDGRVAVACGRVEGEGWSVPGPTFLASLHEERRSLGPNDTAPSVAPRPLGTLFGRRFGTDARNADAEVAPAPSRVAGVEHMLVDERLHWGTLRDLRDAVERRARAIELSGADVDLYSPEVLYWHQDFRVLLALEYVSALAEGYGVQTDLQSVLSMPLGASEITLEEVTAVYGGITTGLSWRFPGRAHGRRVESPPAPTLLIAELRDVDGNVLYRAEPESVRLASRQSAHLTADILRNVVLHGTGARARDAIRVNGGVVPLGGKTGTTNQFKNVAFLGFAPSAWSSEGYVVDDGFVVGAYVGYDDNRPMVNGGVRLAGANGALPVWIGAVQGLADADLLGQPSGDRLSDGAWPMTWAPGLVRLGVDPATGRVTPGVGGATGEGERSSDLASPSLLTQPREEAEDPGFQRVDRPARVAPRTDDIEARRRAPMPLWRR